MQNNSLSPIVSWLSENEINEIYTSSYWNNIEEEKKKEWWIADGNYKKCLDYLKSSGLLDEYSYAQNEVKKITSNNLEIVDIATGIGWASCLFSNLDSIKKVHSVEMSKHRLDDLFEHCTKMLNANNSKIQRYLGSFYDLRFENESMDIVFISRSFHHANNPLKLLSECSRILKNNGTILIVGEHFITKKEWCRRFLSELLKYRNFTTNFYELFRPDELGDHFYRVQDYNFMFKACGLSGNLIELPTSDVMYVVKKLNA